MPDGVFDDSGMPLGAVAKRLGVEVYLHKKKTPNRTAKAAAAAHRRNGVFNENGGRRCPMASLTTSVCPRGLSQSDWGSKDISTKKRRPNGRQKRLQPRIGGTEFSSKMEDGDARWRL